MQKLKQAVINADSLIIVVDPPVWFKKWPYLLSLHWSKDSEIDDQTKWKINVIPIPIPKTIIIIIIITAFKLYYYSPMKKATSEVESFSESTFNM